MDSSYNFLIFLIKIGSILFVIFPYLDKLVCIYRKDYVILKMIYIHIDKELSGVHDSS